MSRTIKIPNCKVLDDEILDSLVTRLRSGDLSVVNDIVEHHIPLALSIVRRRIYHDHLYDDAVGAVFLRMIKTTRSAATKLKDNNITAFLIRGIQSAIKNQFSTDRTIRVPPVTVNRLRKKGKTAQEIFPRVDVTIVDTHDASDVQLNTAYHVPAARRTEPSIEFKEALRMAALLPMEQAIVALRSQGHTYAEVGRKVGYSTPRIGRIIPAIEAKFDKIYT